MGKTKATNFCWLIALALLIRFVSLARYGSWFHQCSFSSARIPKQLAPSILKPIVALCSTGHVQHFALSWVPNNPDLSQAIEIYRSHAYAKNNLEQRLPFYTSAELHPGTRAGFLHFFYTEIRGQKDTS